MKKLLSLFLCLAISISVVSTTIYAVDNESTYNIKELDISISVPHDLIVFEKEVNEDDPNLSLLGIDKQYINEMRETSHSYLDIFDKNNTYNITVSMVNTEFSKNIYDINSYSDEELLSNCNTAIKEINKNNDIKLSDLSIIKYKQTKFINSSFINSSNCIDINGVENFTIINGKQINVNLYNYEELSQEQIDLLNKITESIHFSNIIKRPTRIQYMVKLLLTITLIFAVIYIYKRKKAKRYLS